MTRDEAKKLLPIIKAYSEGKTIQAFGQLFDRERCWYDVDEPHIYPDTEYRIKPEPVETWAVIRRGENYPFGWSTHRERAEEIAAIHDGGRVVLMREVL